MHRDISANIFLGCLFIIQGLKRPDGSTQERRALFLAAALSAGILILRYGRWPRGSTSAAPRHSATNTKGLNMVDAASAAACTVVGLGGIALASCLPTIDLNAVVCAFGGALLFILWAKDITLWQRMGYLLAGWIGGYYGSAEILAQAWTKTSGIAAFSCGLATVLVSISVLESITTGKLPKWVTELPAAIGSLFPKRGGQ
ncbi:putative holin [Pseudomonas asiatica]|uniref:putative holin n=2 Tax=Pseudomonas TaxID=286 RepID=UPI00207B5E30|nr:putative holin [Pseudomonas asiatica]